MEKNNINTLVTIGKSKKFKPSNRFEMNVAELVTSLILDPSYGLNCSFVSENNKTSLVISPVSSMYRFEPVTVHIDGKESLTRDLQLISATAKVHKFLNQRKLLNPYEFGLSQGEHILESTLDRVAERFQRGLRYSSDKEEYLARLSDRVLKMNAFRKMVSKNGNGLKEDAECTIATTLGFINYFSNDVNNSDNPMHRCSINETTFFQSLEHLKYINKAIAFGMNNDIRINNFACARVPSDDKKSEYLAGLNFYKIRDGQRFSSLEIDPSVCNEVISCTSPQM